MSYQVLARKWRPRNFSEMVGQEHVLKALINSLNQQRLHHAYLFSGTRGVGKTTVARILAKALNCEQGISASPCEQCKICKDISAGQFIDLIEVDAASRTKVEDTREILDNVPYLPSQGRFKIYLIDEVHMLSGHSFNALLKTLEEPPAHVKFLFATTEPQKLPVTILSRCLQFNLKNMLPEQISDHLKTVLDSEAYPYQPEALDHIARAASGSMRDALSLLDQALAFGDNTIEVSSICQMLGYVEQTHVLDLLNALANSNAQNLLESTHQLLQQGADFHHVLDQLLTLLHQLTIMQCTPSQQGLADSEQNNLRSIVQIISPQDTQLFYQIALKGRQDIDFAPTPKIGFEMTLLRMLAFQPANKQSSPPLECQLPRSHQHKKHTTTQTPTQKNDTDIPPHSHLYVADTVETPTVKQAETENHSIKVTTHPTSKSPGLSSGSKYFMNVTGPRSQAAGRREQAAGREEQAASRGEQAERRGEQVAGRGNEQAPRKQGDIHYTSAHQAEQSAAFDDDLGPLYLDEIYEQSQHGSQSLETKATLPPKTSSEEQALFAGDTNTLDETLTIDNSGITTHTTPTPHEKSTSHRDQQTNQENDLPDWAQVISRLKLSGMALSVLQHTQIKAFTADSIDLQIEASHQSMLTQAARDRIKSAICHYFNKTYQIHFSTTDAPIHSPARKQEQQRKQHSQEANHSIQHDATVQKIIQTFDASIVQGSIQATKKLVE